MTKFSVLLFSFSLFAADPPKPPTVEQQLAEAKAEIAALREAYTAMQDQAIRNMGALNGCLASKPVPQIPAPKPEPAK